MNLKVQGTKAESDRRQIRKVPKGLRLGLGLGLQLGLGLGLGLEQFFERRSGSSNSG